MYAVFDTKDNEICVGVFEKIGEVAEYFNTTKESISSSICRKEKRKHRFLVIKIKEE